LGEGKIIEKARTTQEAKLSSALLRVRDYLIKRGVESYLVGGYVRDMLLDESIADVDIAVAADAPQIADAIAHLIGGRYVLMDEINRVARIVLPIDEGRHFLDFSTLRGSIEEDLSRRDFTINAMAIELEHLREDLSQVHIIDPLDGRGDLEGKLIRVVSSTGFDDDPVRLLRAVRLAAELGFDIDEKTKALIKTQSEFVNRVAGERAREELCRIFAAPNVGMSLHSLDKLGLLGVLIPELNPARGVEQPIVHFWDVFDHSIETAAAVERLFKREDNIIEAVPWSPELKQHFNEEIGGVTRKTLMKIAALLHDIAKPQTKSVNENGRAHFLGHPKIGAEIAGEILERLRFSNRQIKIVQTMVRYHLRIGQMSEPGELPSNRAIYRYFRDTGEVAIDTLFLSLADHLATSGPKLDLSLWQWHDHLVEYVLSEYKREEKVVRPPKLVDGHDLMNAFHLRPGPKIGELLEAAREAQATGEITTKEDALALVQKLLYLESENN
jgi:poly(A) polymerase